MAVNKSNKQRSIARHPEEVQMTLKGNYVVQEESSLEALHTERNPYYFAPHSSYASGHLSIQDRLSLSPVQVDRTPPDSVHQEVARNGDNFANQCRYGTKVQNDATSAETQTRRDVATETEPTIECKLQTKTNRNTAANQFNPGDVTIKSATEVLNDQGTKKMAILFVGNIAVGKTSLIGKIQQEQCQSLYEQTINFTPTEIGATVRGQSYIVRLLDTSGEEKFQSMMQSFYKHGHGAMIVYNITDYNTFDAVDDWYSALQKNCNILENIKFPIILLGNKVDLSDRHVNGSNTADNLEMDGFFKTSALTGKGITDAVKMMISLIDDRCRNSLALLSNQGIIVQGNDNNIHKKGCC